MPKHLLHMCVYIGQFEKNILFENPTLPVHKIMQENFLT